MSEIKTRMLEKVFSGRFLLAMGLGVTFCILAIKGVIPPEDFKAAFLVVLYGYFTRDRSEKSLP
jgi:hypothetical protein